MAAAIGDQEWLRQSLRGNRGKINYDKSVSLSMFASQRLQFIVVVVVDLRNANGYLRLELELLCTTVYTT